MTPHSLVPSILLVDDHPANLLALEAVLEPLGMHLVRASSGKEALTHLLREEFAAIVLDVQMPDMDGFEVAALIRRRERTKEVPIIFISAIHRDDSYQAKGYAHGAVDYLPKPFNPDVLRAKVSALADLWRRGETSRMKEVIAFERERADLLAREHRAQIEALAERENLHRLIVQAPVAIALVRGPEHVFEMANAHYLRVFGRKDVVGKNVRQVFPEPELAAQGLWKIWDRTYETGEPFVAPEFAVTWDRRGNGHPEPGLFSLTLTPIRDGAGTVTGLMVVAVELGEGKRAQP